MEVRLLRVASISGELHFLRILLTSTLFLSSLEWGFRNQCMAFTYFVLEALERKFPQVLLESVTFQDFLGTRRRVAFENIFDVTHWNAHYPALPRLVRFDPVQHKEWTLWRMIYTWICSYRQFWNPAEGFTKPYTFGSMPDLLNAYKSYTAEINLNRIPRDPAELLMLQRALRPHPDLRHLLDRLRSDIKHSTNQNNDYMALHARVEPDMTGHVFCKWAKVKNLTTIFHLLERDVPQPPAPRLFIAINRQLLERYGCDSHSPNRLAVENLRALNHARKHGLWNGTVQVFEAGHQALQGTRFANRPGVFSAAVDYFLAVDAKLFVGTEVSSFSMDIITTRFYRNHSANYLYAPSGVQPATPAGVKQPPRFNC